MVASRTATVVSVVSAFPRRHGALVFYIHSVQTLPDKRTQEGINGHKREQCYSSSGSRTVLPLKHEADDHHHEGADGIRSIAENT